MSWLPFFEFGSLLLHTHVHALQVYIFMWLLFIYAGNSPVSILGFSKGRHHLKIVPLGCGRRYTALPFTFIIWLKTNWYKKKSFLLKIVSIVTNKLLIVLYIFVSVVLCGHFRLWLPSDFDGIASIYSNCYIYNYVPTLECDCHHILMTLLLYIQIAICTTMLLQNNRGEKQWYCWLGKEGSRE